MFKRENNEKEKVNSPLEEKIRGVYMYYYRVVDNYLGEEVVFNPEHSYENVDFINSKLTFVDYDIKEVCFSKSIQCCFFAISMFLKLNKKYYIYRTSEKPCIDLSGFNKGDFIANKEVRFRKPVKAEYIGSLKTNDNFYENIKELYNNCNYNENFFDNKYALSILETNYNLIYFEIEYKNDLLKSEYTRNKRC